MPRRIPPMMVAPEREVPGIRASSWKIPINSASLKEISLSFVLLGFRLLL
jgi:hypothetical protein